KHLYTGLQFRAITIDQLGVDQLVLQRIGVFDIADRAGRPRCQRRDAFISLAAETYWPFDRGALADLVLPFWAYLREIVSKDEGSPGPVRTVYHGNRRVGQLQAWIELPNRGITPFSDLSQIDVGDGRPVERHLARLNLRKIHDHDLGADDWRELGEAGLLE